LTSTGVGGRNGRERQIVGLGNFTIKRRGHMSLSDPVLTGPHAGRTVTSGHGSTAELKLAGEESGGDWAVVEWRVRAGDDPPIHTHTREDETIYVLDGAITAFVGDERIEVEAGSYAALPKDVPRPDRARRGSASARHARARGCGVLPRPPRRERRRPRAIRADRAGACNGSLIGR